MPGTRTLSAVFGEYHVRGPVPFADVHRAASVELVYVDKIWEEAEVRVLLMATSE
jgi:hypothetical protein